MKNLITAIFLMTSIISVGQTVSKKPIYKGNQRLTVQELDRGAIMFSYQNRDYTTIVALEYFVCEDKEETIAFLDKSIEILAMDKTDKDEHITYEDNGKTIKRYSFAQKNVYIFNKNMKSLILNLKSITKIKAALLK